MPIENVSSTHGWHKSSHSGGEGDCVEVSEHSPHTTSVRDSKSPTGISLVFPTEKWREFIDRINNLTTTEARH